MKYKTTVGDQQFDIEIIQDNEVIVNGQRAPVDFRWLEGRAIFSLLLEHNSYEALVEERGDVYHVLLGGRMFNVRVENELTQYLKQAHRKFAPPTGELAIRAPMPGLVVMTPVRVGQEVQEGDTLVILESMKMENEIKSPRAGQVTAIRVQPRQSVALNQILLVLS